MLWFFAFNPSRSLTIWSIPASAVAPKHGFPGPEPAPEQAFGADNAFRDCALSTIEVSFARELSQKPAARDNGTLQQPILATEGIEFVNQEWRWPSGGVASLFNVLSEAPGSGPGSCRKIRERPVMAQISGPTRLFYLNLFIEIKESPKKTHGPLDTWLKVNL
jgi:hypothetical protein